MLRRDYCRLGVTVEPGPGESAMSLLLRAFQANGSGYEEGMRWLGLDRRQAIAESDVLALAWALNVDADDLRRRLVVLEWRGGGRWVHLAGQRLSRWIAPTCMTAKVCALCLRETGFAKMVWMTRAAPACARHGYSLLQKCASCGKPIRWARPGVHLCRCGRFLRSAGVPEPVPPELHAWLNWTEAVIAGDIVAAAEALQRLQQRSEPLVSNWLQVDGQPKIIRHIESRVGASLERFQNRLLHDWPVVPFRGGVITFALPDEAGNLATELPGKEVAALPTAEFLAVGWEELKISPFEARRMYADLGSQAFDRFCRKRGLKGHLGSGRRVSWFGDIKTTPQGRVKFDWPYRRGSRQIIGQSGKRNVHWHYGINAQLRTSPIAHFRLSARLVFSENGLDAIEDKKRSHSLRRSFAKGWRNARWRDMLCAYLWWLAEGKASIWMPVGADAYIQAAVPPMQFGCPVTISEGKDLDQADDDDDPDIPDDLPDEEQGEERDE